MFEASALKKQNDTLQLRIQELEEALRRVLRHEPWPGSDTSESDFNHAHEVLEKLHALRPQRREPPTDGSAS